jgi:multicomponent Na+:H+ antiporter subunit G
MSVADAPLVEWLAAACLLFGGLFTLVAGIGLLRLGDVFLRLHASTKAGTMGAGLIGVALALAAQDAGVASRAVICVVFLLLTAPVGAHLIGRAAARELTPPDARNPADGAGR